MIIVENRARRWFLECMAKLVMQQISKAFGDTRVVENLDLEIDEGELFVLLGPSGCGKSTVLRLIAGLEEIDSGQMFISGREVNHVAPKDRNVAMVFQNYALYPHMTIYDNLAFPLKIRKMDKSEIERIVSKQAELLGLSDLLERKPKTLSGGQRQRVALGRALVRQPDVFLFDEPLSNLDAKLRISTRAEIARLQRKLSATMVYVTHDQEEALSLGHRIAILYDGRLQQVGNPREIYDKPANLFCATFVGSPRMNLLAGSVSSDGLQVSAGSVLKIPAGIMDKLKSSAVTLGIRPEKIHLNSHDHDLQLKAKAYYSEFAGDKHIVFARLGDQELRVKTDKQVDFSAQTDVSLCFSSTDCHFFDSDGIRIE